MVNPYAPFLATAAIMVVKDFVKFNGRTPSDEKSSFCLFWPGELKSCLTFSKINNYVIELIHYMLKSLMESITRVYLLHQLVI